MDKSTSKPQVGDNDLPLHAVDELSFDTLYEPLDESIFKNFDSCKRSAPALFTEIPEERKVDQSRQSDENFDEADSSFSSTSNNEKCFRIADDAIQTCETVLGGFVMGTTTNILINGETLHDCHLFTEYSKEMLASLLQNSKQWKDTKTTEGIRLRQLAELLYAIQEHDYEKILKIYYRAQHQHTFNVEDKLFVVPVFLHKELDKDWIKPINKAITEINIAAPGINLHTTPIQSQSLIEIGVSSKESSKTACTFGSVYDLSANRAKPFIHLGSDWNRSNMDGTSLHELMHALSFPHEMQRFDFQMYLDIDGKDGPNYAIKYDQFLTRFDPFSVMMYSEGRGMTRKPDDKIWKLKPTTKRPQVLSELNKVALNMKFKPCKTTIANMVYDPKPNIDMQMLYCGREVMITHNQVGKPSTNGRCGPKNWANCPACRVIIRIEGKEPHVLQKWRKCLDNGKWQGLSGLFYCGKDLSGWIKSRQCGPDTGDPCEDCVKEVYKEQGSS